VLAGCTLRSSSAGQRQELRPARRVGAWSGAVVPGAQPVPGAADLGADAAQTRRELGVLVTGQGHQHLAAFVSSPLAGRLLCRVT